MEQSQAILALLKRFWMCGWGADLFFNANGSWTAVIGTKPFLGNFERWRETYPTYEEAYAALWSRRPPFWIS